MPAKQPTHQFTLLKPAEKRHLSSHRAPRSKLAATRIYQEAAQFLQNAKQNRVGPYEIGFVIDLVEPEVKKELSVLKNPKLSLTFTLRDMLKKLDLTKQLRVSQQGDEIAVVGVGDLE
jgi:hypothetical protein